MADSVDNVDLSLTAPVCDQLQTFLRLNQRDYLVFTDGEALVVHCAESVVFDSLLQGASLLLHSVSSCVKDIDIAELRLGPAVEAANH